MITFKLNHVYREEQCAKFNQELFERKYYDWIPYLKAPRKCELNCMPKGERFYYRHAKKVCSSTVERMSIKKVSPSNVMNFLTSIMMYS